MSPIPTNKVVIRLNLEEGRRLRDIGAGLAGGASDEASIWRSNAAQTIERLAASGVEFSADDVISEVGMPPKPNMVGAAFLSASKRKVIHSVGMTQGARPESHARVQRLWVGTVT